MAKHTTSQSSSMRQTILPVTCLEDLSNELLYDIFDYFDYSSIYETFSNLNNRFYHLIIHSSLPLNLNFSFLSKATFQYQCEKILLPNMHRIISIDLSHQLLIESFFQSFSLNDSYIRLEVLTLNNFKEDTLFNILSTFISLPRLFSLTLASTEKLESRNRLYSSLLLLPVLKYCKLSLNISGQYQDSSSSIMISPIEHLILDTKHDLDEIMALLGRTPFINRLSCRISMSPGSLSEWIPVPESLKEISFQLEDTSFDEFEWSITYFSNPLQVLRISTKHDIEFLNADRWQRLITKHMPVLQKFIFQHEERENENDELYHHLMEKFNSPFWFERQWFFTHRHYQWTDLHSWIGFYSTRPYRWNRYVLLEDPCQYSETGVNLASEVDFHRYGTTTLRFPRASRLILSEGNMTDPSSFISNLTSLFSPTQLTELVISDEQLRFEQLLLLLHHFSNIRLLTIPTSILSLSSSQSQTNCLQCPMTSIVQVTIVDRCTLEDLQILQRFCPSLQSLEIEVEKGILELVVSFLLSKNTNRILRNQFPTHPHAENLMFWKPEYSTCIPCRKHQNINSIRSPCDHHLSSICFRDVNYRMINKIRTMIDQDVLLENYSIEYIDQKMFLWW